MFFTSSSLDERVDRIYYFNVKTQKTQWNHPLDKHFENLVKKTREGSLSAGLRVFYVTVQISTFFENVSSNLLTCSIK